MKTQISKWLIVIATFVSLMFVVTGLEAGKPDKDKPPKPDQTEAECIVFTGDLIGKAVVEGCCTNGPPHPWYSMDLHLHYDIEDEIDFEGNGSYEGQLFINNWGAGRNHGYIVQFWNYEDYEYPICFEIIGGVIDNDKKSKVLTVTFEDEPALCEYGGEVITLPFVSFTLLRTSDLSYCQ
ncbi:MAG: hypothetical protein GQ528_06100 [Woeseiaceae bacterium]|nr:hypothetical protein [Woeseiaceae bacterium]